MEQNMEQNTEQNMEQNMGEKKCKFGDKVGQFLLTILPVITFFVIQFVVSYAIMFGVTLNLILKQGGAFANQADLINQVYSIILNDLNPIMIFCIHIVTCLTFGFWYYFSFKKPRPRLSPSFQKLNGKIVGMVIVYGVLLCLFANGTVLMEEFLMPEAFGEYVQMSEMAGLGTNPFAIFAAIILAPLGEELLCRGLILKFGKKCFGSFWVANVVQALCFGLIHLNWIQGIYAFVIGLMLGYFVEKYKTILPAMLGHLVVNFSSSTFIVFLLAPIPETLVAGILLTLLTAIAILGLLFWERKKEVQS